MDITGAHIFIISLLIALLVMYMKFQLDVDPDAPPPSNGSQPIDRDVYVRQAQIAALSFVGGMLLIASPIVYWRQTQCCKL